MGGFRIRFPITCQVKSKSQSGMGSVLRLAAFIFAPVAVSFWFCNGSKQG